MAVSCIGVPPCSLSQVTACSTCETVLYMHVLLASHNGACIKTTWTCGSHDWHAHELTLCWAQDFLFTYKSGIQAVAPSDVLRAAANHLHVGQQTMVITADTRLVKQQLEDAGFRVQTLVVHDSK